MFEGDIISLTYIEHDQNRIQSTVKRDETQQINHVFQGSIHTLDVLGFKFVSSVKILTFVFHHEAQTQCSISNFQQK